MTTDNIALGGFEEVTIAFDYYPVSMENGEDFWLQGSLNGGSTWTTVATWSRGTDFQNGSSYSDQVIITGNYTNTTKFRFRCDASANNDRVYIDDVDITGCVNGNKEIEDVDGQVQPTPLESISQKSESLISDMTVYPSPTRDILNVEYEINVDSEVAMTVLDVNGKVISSNALEARSGAQKLKVDASDFDAGFYFINLRAGDKIITKRFIVIK